MNNRIVTCAMAAILMAGAVVLPSCGDEEAKPKTYSKPSSGDDKDKPSDKPSGGSTTSSLWPSVNRNTYLPGTFRGSINYEKHPIFRVACGITAPEFLNENHPAAKAVFEHFDEITFGNELKYQSCVSPTGEMNFSTVKAMLDMAKKHNITVFGHTLAWHSQQQKEYLGKLVAKGSDADKKEALIEELKRWIGGCMEACKGQITCWDAVNEALSGGGDYKGMDIYTLQGTGSTDPNNLNNEDYGANFYWQDFLGSEDYIPIVFSIARDKFEDYGGNPDHLKLFINDYNLESTWDDNKKLRSLIRWIQIWEANKKYDCYIDGIGSQMHISCYENDADNENLKDHIVTMYKLMASTGKLCKVSELDMGYVRGSGKSQYPVQYDELTDEEAQKMADLYEFVVTKYFEIIPADQQFGITQWCLTDSPKNSGWRGGTPAGFWKLDFAEKWPMFDGFMKGLENSEDYEK